MQLRDRQALRGRSAQAAGQASSPVTFSLKPVPSVPASFLTSTPTTFALSQQGPDQPVVPSSVYLAPATRQRPHFPLPANSLWTPTHRMQPACCPAWSTRCSALPCPPARSPALPPAGPAQGPQILSTLLQDGPVVRPVLITRTLTSGFTLCCFTCGVLAHQEGRKLLRRGRVWRLSPTSAVKDGEH